MAVLQREHMSLSTIYRALGALTEKEILLKNAGQDGKTYYQMNTRRHKHYLRCTGCNEIVPLNDCPLHALEKELKNRVPDHRPQPGADRALPKMRRQKKQPAQPVSPSGFLF